MFKEVFCGKENLKLQMGDVAGHQAANTMTLSEGVDAEVLGNPKMKAISTALEKYVLRRGVMLRWEMFSWERFL